jgi:hypothetical protein
MSWSRTVVAFWIAALGAGTLFFGLLGVVGSAVGLTRFSPWLSIVAVGLAFVLDSVGVTAPGPQRQVNEEWLGRYRDWVVGSGFGGQLGLGFVTYVPTFGLWALYVVAASMGLPAAALIGVGFGLGRSLLLLTTRSITSPGSLSTVMRRFAGAETQARWLTQASYGLVILMVAVDVI